MESLWQDLRYGARLLRLNPGFTIVAILSLALGIGANTAIFQLLDAVRLRTLPVKDPQELAEIRIANRDHASGRFSGRFSRLTNPMWESIRQQQQGFSSVTAFGTDSFNLARGGPARYAQGVWASGDFFNTLGVPAMIGRVFTAADDQRGCGSPGVVISYSFWQREFGGDPPAVGRLLSLEGHPFPIIGVTPAGFYGVEVGRNYDVAVPLCAEPIIKGEDTQLDRRNSWWLACIGRLKPGWTLSKATAQLAAISPGLFEAIVPPMYTPESAKYYREYRLGAFPAGTGLSALRQDYEKPLWFLLGIAALVLLIACANLANLMLAQASARGREIAVRLALGAARFRLLRQLMAESLLLAILGTLVGALLATTLSSSMVKFLSTESRRIFVDLAPDWRMFAFTAGLAVFTCLLFGLLPALRASRTDPGNVLKATGRGLTTTRERFGLRRALVVAQVAMSLVLVVGALLFVRSLRNLTTQDPGFLQAGILVTDVDITRLKLPKDRRLPFKKDLAERVAAIPGVQSVAEVSIVPVSGSGWNQTVIINGEKKTSSLLNRIGPNYFETMGTSLLEGRDFDQRDTAGSPKVAIVNDEFVKKFFNGADPIGKTFKLEQGPGEEQPTFEIVGRVRNTKYYRMSDNFEPVAYFPMTQDLRPDNYDDLMIRSSMPMGDVMNAVKHVVAEVNPEITLDFHVFQTQIKEGLLRERLMATLSGFFGFLAALLATIGLYGVISYMVARRTNEIGVRMALGANPGAIARMILGEAGSLLGIGVIVGAVLALAAARAATTMLFGLKPSDPVTLLMSIAGLGVVAVAASYLPARRAAKLDPMVALRDE